MNLQLNGQSLPSDATDIRITKGGAIATAPKLTLSLPSAPERFLYSGWQSWSLTAWVNTDRPIRPMRPSIMHPLQTDPFYARERRPNGSWYGAVELCDGQVIFLGALGLESHVMLDGQSLIGTYEQGDGDWFIANGDETEFMIRYAELLSERLGSGRPKSSPRVWCSWYSLYTEIHEQQLLKVLGDLGTLDSAHGLPFDIFQIDDGWQISIGDWEPNDKFSSGMDRLAAQIKETGRKAGLWLAPLLVVRSSGIYHEHKDWLLHDENSKLVSAGFNWSEPLYALDTTHPAVLDWLAALMKKIHSWGYDYIKLDFLYAGALPGKRFVEMPREAAYRNGLKTIRTASGEAYLLTCGAPILPSIGLCDGIRIGPDAAGHFSSHRDDDLLMNFAIPGTRNAMRTAFNRLWLQSLVNTDPDVVYFCTRQNNLSPEQKSLLQDLAQICSFKASSDIPAWLTETERSALRIFLENRPRVRKIGRTAYQIGDHAVDFGPHIGLPALPGTITQWQGAVIGGLANVPILMKVFDKLVKIKLQKMLKQYPV
jgi:alpha-galactosidase